MSIIYICEILIYLEQRVEQMENDLRQNNSHNLFKSVRELEEK